MENGGKKKNGENKKQIKYSINLKGSLASTIKVFTDQSHISEDLALSEVINATDCLTGNVDVFDRGLQKRACPDTFTGSNKLFVTRGKIGVKYKTVKELAIEEHPPEDNTEEAVEDSVACLYDDKRRESKYLYQVIRARLKQSGEEIIFISNLLEEKASFIAKLYFARYSFVHYRYPAGNNPAGIKHPPIAMLHWGLLTFNPSGCRLPALIINH